MARAFTDNVNVQVFEEQVMKMLFRLEVATSQIGLASWANTEIDPWLQTRAAGRFSKEGDAASGGWKPLSALTQEWRGMQGYSPAHPINVRSGALRDYMTSEAEGTWITRGHESGEYVWPGAALPYTDFIAAKLHTAQLGRKRGENRLFPRATTPKRPVAAIDEIDVLALLTSYANYVETYVGADAGMATVSGVFGGSITTPSSAVRGRAFAGSGGNFS